jgi:hypothetical protein
MNLKKLYKEYLKKVKLHRHWFIIHMTQEELWLECSCGKQEDIPDEKLDQAYEKIRNNEWDWGETV